MKDVIRIHDDLHEISELAQSCLDLLAELNVATADESQAAKVSHIQPENDETTLNLARGLKTLRGHSFAELSTMAQLLLIPNRIKKGKKSRMKKLRRHMSEALRHSSERIKIFEKLLRDQNR